MSLSKLPQLQQKEIAEVLTAFGLHTKDQEVYVALLQMGQTTITPLARAIHLPVTTVQSVLARLVHTGLIGVSKHKTRHAYEAHDPNVLKRLLETRLQEVTHAIPLLHALKAPSIATPKIRVFYRERITDILAASLLVKNKVVHEIVAASDFQNMLGEKYHYTRRRIAARVQLKSLRVEQHEIKKYNKSTHERELREAKFLPRELTFRTSLMFWDNTIAFFTTKEEGLCWTVESATLRETYEQLFALLWSVSRRMETIPEEATK